MKKKNKNFILVYPKDFILLFPFILIDSHFIMKNYKRQDIIIIPPIKYRICILSFRNRPKRKSNYDTFLLAYNTANILLRNYRCIFVVLKTVNIHHLFLFIKKNKRKLIKRLKLKPNRRVNCFEFLLKNNKIFIRLLLFYLKLTALKPLSRNFNYFLLDVNCSCKQIFVTFKKTKELLCLFILSINVRYEFNTFKISLFFWIYKPKCSLYIRISTYTSFHYFYNLELTVSKRQLIPFLKKARFLSKVFKKLYMKHIEYSEEYFYKIEKEIFTLGKQRVMSNTYLLFCVNLIDYFGSPKLVFKHFGHEIFINKDKLTCVNILIYMYNIEDPIEFAREKKLGFIIIKDSTSYRDVENFILRCFDLYRKITLDSFYKEYTKDHLVLRIWRKKGIKESHVSLNPFVYYKTVNISNLAEKEKDIFYLEEEAFRNEMRTTDFFDFDFSNLTINDEDNPI